MRVLPSEPVQWPRVIMERALDGIQKFLSNVCSYLRKFISSPVGLSPNIVGPSSVLGKALASPPFHVSTV